MTRMKREKKTGTFMQTEESHVTTETGDTSTKQGEQAELRQSMEQTLPQSLQKSQSCQHVDLDF